MSKKIALLLTCLFAMVSMAFAQSRVTGVVTAEEDGEPVMGASILVKGTTVGTVTDMDGKFTLTGIPSSAKTLVISYIGMKTQEVAIKPNIKVMLASDTEVLDEVMVVAFGTQKKSAFTGSAAVVDNKSISEHVTTNVANALVGSVPGLQIRGGSGAPGAETGTISIRGVGSMYAESTPLIIVDGAPFPGNLSTIPQGDIESVTVLKDAASAALYGARGAAGVILITTKKGNSSDARINLDMKWGSMSRAVQEYDKITDPGEFYEAYYQQVYNYETNKMGLSGAEANVAANEKMLDLLQYNVYDVPAGQQLIGMDGKLNPAAKLGRAYDYNGETYYLLPDDWTKAAYRKALRQEYNLSASGGSDKATFYTSLGYLNEEGILHHSGYERYTGRLKADYQAKKWLKLGANVAYTHGVTTSNPNISSSSSNETNPAYFTTYIAPIYPIYIRKVINGQPVIAQDQYGHDAYDYARTAADTYPGIVRPFLSGNPLGANYYNKRSLLSDQLNATFNADFQFTDWLKLAIATNVTLNQNQDSSYSTMYYGPSVSIHGSLNKYNTNVLRTNNTQTLNFFKDFGKHSVSALVGHEYYRIDTRRLSATGQGMFSEDILEIYAAAKKSDANSYTLTYNVEGYFGSANYNYDEKYFASASFRRDASSRFATENRWGNFWSIGGAWMMSKENFMQGTSNWLDQLKFKFSIGQQGNDNLGSDYYAYFRYTDIYQLGVSGTYSMTPSLVYKGNKDITWETTTNINAGLEFSLFKGRLAGSVDLYSKTITDLLFSLNVPLSAGYGSYFSNVGDIRNTGVEVQLNGTLVRTKDFDLTLGINASHNKTKIIKLPEAQIADNGGFVSSNRWFAEGQPYYNPFRYSYAGVNEQGEALYWVDDNVGHDTAKPGVNKDRKVTNPNEASYYTMGEIYPALVGGINIGMRYKNFDVSLNFDYQLGGKIYDSQYASMMGPDADSSSGYTIHKDYVNSWTPQNTNAANPRWQFGDQYTATASDRFYMNSSYFNFQSFTVGYTLPKKWTRPLQMSSIRIYAAGENLGFISARQGLDPRANTVASTSGMAAYNQAIRNISGGIQVQF